jgi:hypothetical protein
VEVAGQLLVVARWVVVAQIPEVRGLLAAVTEGILLNCEKPLLDTVEFAVSDAVTGDQSPQRGEGLGWEGLLAMHAPGLAEEPHDALKIGLREPHDLPRPERYDGCHMEAMATGLQTPVDATKAEIHLGRRRRLCGG